MCYTPIVSLTTALVEFLIVIWLFAVVSDKRLLSAPYFVFFLGLYQLSEFFLCVSSHFFWARIGFAVYTLLPMLYSHLLLRLGGRRVFLWFYSFPLLFVALALWYPDFIGNAFCQGFYVVSEVLFFNEHHWLFWPYFIYYFLLPSFATYLFLRHRIHVPLRMDTWYEYLEVAFFPLAIGFSLLFIAYEFSDMLLSSFLWIVFTVGVLIVSLLLLVFSLIPVNRRLFLFVDIAVLFFILVMTYVLFVLLPMMSVVMASVYCHFALLYALGVILLVRVVQRER